MGFEASFQPLMHMIANLELAIVIFGAGLFLIACCSMMMHLRMNLIFNEVEEEEA